MVRLMVLTMVPVLVRMVVDGVAIVLDNCCAVAGTCQSGPTRAGASGSVGRLAPARSRRDLCAGPCSRPRSGVTGVTGVTSVTGMLCTEAPDTDGL